MTPPFALTDRAAWNAYVRGARRGHLFPPRRMAVRAEAFLRASVPLSCWPSPRAVRFVVSCRSRTSRACCSATHWSRPHSASTVASLRRTTRRTPRSRSLPVIWPASSDVDHLEMRNRRRQHPGLGVQGPVRNVSQADRSRSRKEHAGHPAQAACDGAQGHQGRIARRDRRQRRPSLRHLHREPAQPGYAAVLTQLPARVEGRVRRELRHRQYPQGRPDRRERPQLLLP